MYCKKCGGKIESYANNCAFCGTPVEKYDTNINYVVPQQKANDYRPMTTAKWLGLTLLPFIPGIGTIIYLILILKWAFGPTKDLTLKGFARANLIILIISIIFITAASMIILQFLPELLEELKAI